MSQHHRQKRWANHAAKARKEIAVQLPLPCHHCGRPVHADTPWDVGHIVDLAHGGDAKAYTAAHRSCNRSAGGKAGAAKTNAMRKQFRSW